MLRPTPESDAAEHLHFMFSRRYLSFGPEEFCIVSGLYMGHFPISRIEFSTIYNHRYGDNTFRSKVFPCRTATTLLVKHLELLILNRRFNEISTDDVVRAILLYILNQGFLEKEPKDKVTKKILWVVENLDKWNMYLSI
ncbi:unnamed protein product [Lactuca saligna]|uniref:DUF1985 domain-containing protein n=1 Tax=Lactuca saligna TaxID=75948 RepID=A0AA35ZXD8_LACSI|nr:unnamed protein product [Lactuca saligna]